MKLLFPGKTKAWSASEDLAFRVRSTVCRGPGDKAVSKQVANEFCKISAESLEKLTFVTNKNGIFCFIESCSDHSVRNTIEITCYYY